MTEKQARVDPVRGEQGRKTEAATKGLGTEDVVIPYRTPTQVGRSRRPRWTREPTLRNSAKLTP